MNVLVKVSTPSEEDELGQRLRASTECLCAAWAAAAFALLSTGKLLPLFKVRCLELVCSHLAAQMSSFHLA